MDYNLFGYAIYLVITAIIIVRVGKICYRNGNVFVAELIPNHEELCKRTNQILLLGYYLLNIGYCAITLVQWDTIASVQQLVETISVKTAVIVCIIAALHYVNIYLVTYQLKKIIH